MNRKKLASSNGESVESMSLCSIGDDDDIKSVWTTDTHEINWSRVNGDRTSAGLPTAISSTIDRSGIFNKQKEELKPFELSTAVNAHLLEELSDNNLLHSITEIWIRTQLHDGSLRASNVAWYNWVLLDISRRVHEIYRRSDSDNLIFSLINMIANRVYYQSVSINLTQDGRTLTHYPLFHLEKITRLIKLGAKFSDTVCAASESIDFMFILNMTKDEFIEFYDQMLRSKPTLYERSKLVRAAFHSINPLGPFKPIRPV